MVNPVVLQAGDEEDGGDQDREPHTPDWDYYMQYINQSGYVEEPLNETDDNETGPGGNGTGSPQDGSWPYPGWPPFPIGVVPDPVPCVSYNTSHPLVQKQFQREELTRYEIIALVEEPSGFAHTECLPAPGTYMIKTKQHKKTCLYPGVAYTVCFTERSKDHLRCGIFVAGARGRRESGSVDCMGGCNEGSTACNVRSHRGACFTHDLCSIVLDASGFTFHRECGDEAWAAVRGNGMCKGTRW